MNLGLSGLPWHGQVGAFVALSAAATGVFSSWYVRPAKESIATRRAELARLGGDIDRGLATTRTLPDLRHEVADLRTQLDRLRDVLPKERDVADLLRRVQATAARSNLTMLGFTPQAVATRQLHAEWPIGLQIEGTYHDLAAFLDRISRFPRIIHVSGIAIRTKEGAAGAATITAQCIATTFVLIDQQDEQEESAAEQPPPPPPAGNGTTPSPTELTPSNYSSEGRRDPFVRPQRRDAPASRVVERARPAGLAGLAVAEVTLRGTVRSREGFVAILQGADRKTYIVRAGDKLFDGTVWTISQDDMVIQRQGDSPLPPDEPREVRKMLRQAEAK